MAVLRAWEQRPDSFATPVQHALSRLHRWRAKREFGLSSVNDAFTGIVTVIQRFVHFMEHAI